MYVKDQKNDVVARCVVIGDVDGSGEINSDDAEKALKYMEGIGNFENYQLIAMNVNNDEYIGTVDSKLMLAVGIRMVSKEDVDSWNNADIKDPNKLITKSEKESMEAYINSLTPENNLYKWKYVSGINYKIIGNITSETTGDDIVNGLGLKGKAYIKRIIRDDDEGTEIIKKITTEAVENGDYLILIDEVVIYGNVVCSQGGSVATISK